MKQKCLEKIFYIHKTIIHLRSRTINAINTQTKYFAQIRIAFLETLAKLKGGVFSTASLFNNFLTSGLRKFA